ncbi:MAG: WYL domain-containing protein [Candidatus Binatia bacterium]|jgi:predicted DNA-binding transcriptional regulator YafY
MGKQRRTPTYGAATRLARIVHELSSRPRGWTLEAIQDEIGISERTLLRYLAVCRRELTDATGKPLLEVVRRGDRRLLQLAPRAAAQESTAYELAFLYFALSVFQFLDGTVVKEGVEGLWERLYRALPEAQRLRLADFAKKFYSLPFTVKDYRAFDDTLDVIVQCLVYQHRLRIDYGGLLGEGKVHELDPYTLAMYRGGLYLIGRSQPSRKVLTLAVERIRSAEKLSEKFEYPDRYSPEEYTDGTFGIMDGTVTNVELHILNPETVAYLKARRLHRSQGFEDRRDGTAVLSMTVRGTEELRNWILGFGPWIKVLKPKSLRDEVAQLHRDAARLYGPSR